MKSLITSWVKKLLPFFFEKGVDAVKNSMKDVSGVVLFEDPSTVNVPIKEKSVLIFIHGFKGSKDDTWGDTFKFLRQNPNFAQWDIYSYGYNSGLLPDILKGIWIGMAPLDILGDALRGELENRLNQGYNSVSICAHSMGGLIAQRAVLDLAPNYLNRLNSVILFGTPSAGLNKAQWGKFINDQLRDMGSQSKFISLLRTDWDNKFKGQPPFKFLAVAGDTDEFVTRSTSIDIFPQDQRKVIGGNHIKIVKPVLKSDQTVTTIEDRILNDKNYQFKWAAAAMAMDQANFKEAKEIFDNTGFDNLLEMDKINYILCLEALNKKEEAFEYAKKIKNNGSDAAGILGGRFKRRFLDTRNKSEFDKALEWYTKGYDLAKSLSEQYYPAINIALLYEIQDKKTEAKEWAQKALEQAQESERNDQWEYATQAEAKLHLADFDGALVDYKESLRLTKNLRERESILLNALTAMETLPFPEDHKKKLLDAFAV